MTDRDLLVAMFALVVALVVGATDWLIDLDPSANDAILNTAIVFAVAWTFYRLGKSAP